MHDLIPALTKIIEPLHKSCIQLARRKRIMDLHKILGIYGSQGTEIYLTLAIWRRPLRGRIRNQQKGRNLCDLPLNDELDPLLSNGQ